MSSDSSRKKKARRQQEATGDSYMRARRQVDNDSADPVVGEIPATATEWELLSLLGLDPAGVPDVTALWPRRELPAGTDERVHLDSLLRTPIGLKAGGQPVWLDLKDEAAGGNGPHGLLVGTTGSGKSTALQAMLFALCAQHSPDLLQIVPISAKQASGFADFADYPHTVSIPERDDYGAALRALMDDRAQALSAAEGVDLGDGQAVDLRDGSIDGYLRARAVWTGAELPAVPYTVVVIDETTELVRRDPGLLQVLDTLMRKGRSLGFCVLIVSQSMDHMTVGRLGANTTYRMALRVQTEGESHRLLGSSDAYHLPMDRGLGLYQTAPGGGAVGFRGFRVSRDLVRAVGRHLRSTPAHHR